MITPIEKRGRPPKYVFVGLVCVKIPPQTLAPALIKKSLFGVQTARVVFAEKNMFFRFGLCANPIENIGSNIHKKVTFW